MKKNLLPAYIFAVFIMLFNRSFAQESLMNDVSYPLLDKYIEAAKKNYPLVKVKQEQTIIAKNTYAQSKRSWFELLTFSYLYSPQNNINLAGSSVFTSLFQGYQIAVGLNVGTIFEKPFVIKNAKENYNISLLEQQDYNLTLEMEVRTRYFNYIKQLAILRLRTRTSQDAETIISAAKHQFELGTETSESYTRAMVNFAENNQAKLDAESALLITKASLEQIIGKKLEEVL